MHAGKLGGLPMKPIVDVKPARAFINALRNSDDPFVIFQTVDDHKRPKESEEHRRYTQVIGGRLIDVQKALIALNHGEGGIFIKINAGGRKKHETIYPLALFIDYDGKDNAPKPDLTKLPPSAIVHTSPVSTPQKFHAYWFLKDPESVDLDVWEQGMKQLAIVHKTDPGVATRERCMRLPGFRHNKPGKDPELSVLTELHPERRFTFEEVIAAFPLPEGVTVELQQTNKPRKDDALRSLPSSKLRLVDKPSDGKDFDLKFDPALLGNNGVRSAEETIKGEIDGEEHTPKSLESFERIIAWLKRRNVPYTLKATKPRWIFLERCPLNPMHTDAVIIARTTGATVGKCFHESCGANRQSWKLFKSAIGGWSLLNRGDHPELAQKLIGDLFREWPNLVSDGNRFFGYNSDDGMWKELEDSKLRGRVSTYAGTPVGAKGTPLKLRSSDLQGTVRAAKDLFDAQPRFFVDAPHGAAFPDGFVVVKNTTIEFREHTPANRAQKLHRFPWRSSIGAVPERWLRYLDEVFLPDEDKADKIALLQEFIGACILGIAPTYAAMLFLVGEGENGKSVALEVIEALFPEGDRIAVKPQDMTSSSTGMYLLAMLAGARINLVSEVPEKELMATETFKAVVSGDPITARQIREAPQIIRPVAGHCFACNQLPGTVDFTDGFWRRAMVLEFRRSFKDDPTRERGLGRRIIDEELEAIFAWALQGARRLVGQGDYTIPVSSRVAKQRWRTEADAVALFVEESCDRIETPRTLIGELYSAFGTWAMLNGHQGMSKVGFGRRLRRLKVPRRESNGIITYGLTLKE